MPDNIDKPLGGVGVKWKHIIEYLKTDYYFYIIGVNYKLESELLIKRDGYEYYDESVTVPISTNIHHGIDTSANQEEILKRFSKLVEFAIIIDGLCLHHARTLEKYDIKYMVCLDASIPKINMPLYYKSTDVLNDSCKNILCSEYYYTDFRKDFFEMYKYKNKVIHNSVNADLLNLIPKKKLPGENSKKILFVGRLVDDKNIGEVLSLNLPSDVDLILMGYDEYLPDFYKNILRNTKNYYYLGHVLTEERFSYMKAASAILSPSITEPFGIVCLEALACKVPLLTSFCDGIATWLRQDCAINCGITSTSIMESINYLFSLPQPEVSKLTLCGFDFVKKFSIESMVTEYKKCLDEVTSI